MKNTSSKPSSYLKKNFKNQRPNHDFRIQKNYDIISYVSVINS